MDSLFLRKGIGAESSEVTHEFRFFKVFKDGRVEKFHQTEKIPPSDDPVTGVRSKDVIISPDVSARVFLPRVHDPTRKLPIILYLHGGGFCLESAFSPMYHSFVSNLVHKANVIAVSVEYGIFPERPLPACYEDSWEGLQWLASHADGHGPETWLNDHGDFDRVFVGGDSGGANLTNYLLVRVGSNELPGMKVFGAVYVHPYFGGMEDDAMWLYMYPNNGGLEDPKLKPPLKDLASLGCEKILIFLAEKDHLREIEEQFCEDLKKSGWRGTLEIVEHKGDIHVFHLMNPNCANAMDLVDKFASFISLKNG